MNDIKPIKVSTNEDDGTTQSDYSRSHQSCYVLEPVDNISRLAKLFKNED